MQPKIQIAHLKRGGEHTCRLRPTKMTDKPVTRVSNAQLHLIERFPLTYLEKIRAETQLLNQDRIFWIIYIHTHFLPVGSNSREGKVATLNRMRQL